MTADGPVQLGLVGLGRMGANMVRRLTRGGYCGPNGAGHFVRPGRKVLGFAVTTTLWA
jgi:6-phosphogluconate dehydrogenase (decarboxylating)